MTNTENQELLAGLLAVREECVEEINHHYENTKKFTAATPLVKIKATLEEIESLYREFKENKQNIKMTYKSKLTGDALAKFKKLNLEVSDTHLEVQCRLLSLIPSEENERTVHERTVLDNDR